ncbi:hypothetical protein [Pseudoalteromonas sp. MMG012]|uniref:hypothetical protein n=1 Tax=Pseudoalteromonas sp. MMG012 TaxID=2822686 RepID=UPI001B3A55DC|nr:hypothetical protein [Pseudoalteromonas sp. MMG012]MBQ4851402.1 hypothetical protein [Pseudoalteromonas sp. MMG012]
MLLTVVILASVAFEKSEKDIPLPDLAMLLLNDYKKLSTLPIEKRIDAKREWDSRFQHYCERLEVSPLSEKSFSIQVVK